MNSLTAAVHAIMREAAERAILPRYRTLAKEQVTAKAADDVVTVADHESEAIFAELLSSLLPEAAIVGEEAAFADAALFDRLGDALCWIVDPLDGTNNFASGKPPFGVLGGARGSGRDHRRMDLRPGKGAWIGDDRVQSRASGEELPVAAISLIFMDPARRAAARALLAPHYRLVDIPRCAAEQYPRIVLGQNDVFIFERTLPWDHAAGILFLNEAGGKAARPDGSPYRVADHARPGLFGAASPALWDELAARMAALPARSVVLSPLAAVKDDGERGI